MSAYRSSSLFRAIVLSCLAVGALLVRLPTASHEWRRALCDPDATFHVHRIERTLAHFPKVESIDPYTHHPVGFRIHWLTPHTATYAAIARLLDIGSGDLEHLVAALSWLPPLLGMIPVVLAAALARQYLDDDRAVLAAAALVAFEIGCRRPFEYGSIDHHLFGHIAMMVLVLAGLRRSLAAWIFGLALFFSMTAEATFFVTFLVAALGAAEIIAGPRDPTPLGRRWLWYLAPGLADFGALLLQRALETEPLPISTLSWFYVTPLQPLFLLGFGVAVGSAASWSHEPSAHVKRRALWLLLTGGAVVGVALLFSAAPTVIAEIADKLFKGDRPYVSEEELLLRTWWTSPWYRVVSVFALLAVGRLAAVWWRRSPSRTCFQWLVLAVCFALGSTQMRFSYIVGAIEMVGIAVLMVEAADRMEELPMLRTGRPRAASTAIVALLVVPVFAWQNVVERQAPESDPCATVLPLLREVTDWLSPRRPEPPGIESSAAPFGAIAPWSYGNHLHAVAGIPVVVDAFNDAYDDRRQSIEVLRDIWWTRTSEELDRAMHRYDARYLVLLDPAPDIVSLLGKDSSRAGDLVRRTAVDQKYYGPALNDFAMFRLFMSRGLAADAAHLQLRFVSREADVYQMGSAASAPIGKIRVPKVQIYESKPGATLAGLAPEGVESVSVHFDVHWMPGGRETIATEIAVATDRGFEFHTALPAPYHGDGFEIPGAYFVEIAGREARVPVTQAAVDGGQTIRVEMAW